MLLEAKGLCKAYGRGRSAFSALDQVDLQVGEGACVGIIGGSGSGKSTLAHVIVGLDAADAGSVTFAGCAVDVTREPARRPRAMRRACLGMQMVFQNPAASFSARMSVGRAVMEGLAYTRSCSRAEMRTSMLEALDAVGLPRAYERRYAWELSGGECQRAAIARAIIARPRLLVCDEPTSSLDVTVQAQIIELLDSLRRELSMACLFISHDLALVRGFCDDVYVIERGRVVESGSASCVFENPRHPYTLALVEASVAL